MTIQKNGFAEKWMATTISMITIVGAVFGAYLFLDEQYVNEDDHETQVTMYRQQTEQSNIMIQESLKNIETSAVVERMRGALDAYCEYVDMDLDVMSASDALELGERIARIDGIIEQQVARYKELTGNDFNRGKCENGKRVRL